MRTGKPMAEPLLSFACDSPLPVDPAQALRLIQQAVPPAASERCPLAQAQGRILAADVRSAVALPAFDNAAMDGYALPPGAFPAGCVFTVQGRRIAGDTTSARAFADAACEVMTGAALPPGLASVAAYEQVEVLRRNPAGLPTRIALRAPVRAGQHVRNTGEDVAPGQRVLSAGTRLQATHAMLLSALGVAALSVVRRPRVAVICTGPELIDDASQPLHPGQIRNASGPFLQARLQAAGAQIVHAETIADDPGAWHAALKRTQEARAEIVLSTGAVSMGSHDFVPAALAQSGAQILFQHIAMRPGKPLLCARRRDGALYFGLPGNPASTAVGLRFFVEPALRKMLGLPTEAPQWLPLAAALAARKPGLHHYLKARVGLGTDGRVTVAALPVQETSRLLPLVQANAWLTLPETSRAYAAGELVRVYSLCHEQPLFGNPA